MHILRNKSESLEKRRAGGRPCRVHSRRKHVFLSKFSTIRARYIAARPYITSSYPLIPSHRAQKRRQAGFLAPHSRRVAGGDFQNPLHFSLSAPMPKVERLLRTRAATSVQLPQTDRATASATLDREDPPVAPRLLPSFDPSIVCGFEAVFCAKKGTRTRFAPYVAGQVAETPRR